MTTKNNKSDKKTSPPPDKDEETDSIPDEKEKEEYQVKGLDRKKLAKDKTIDISEVPVTVALPLYFGEKISDLEIQRIERQYALDFLIGPVTIGTKAKPEYASFSAKVTYVGPRRFLSRQAMIALRSKVPNKNFWKFSYEGCRFWHSQEYSGLLKDPEFIKECFDSQNWKIRFVKDHPLPEEEVVKSSLKTNEAQWLGHPFRLREGAILLGQEVPLHRGEARTILDRLKNKTIAIKPQFKHILSYLEDRAKRDLEESRRTQGGKK